MKGESKESEGKGEGAAANRKGKIIEIIKKNSKILVLLLSLSLFTLK